MAAPKCDPVLRASNQRQELAQSHLIEHNDTFNEIAPKLADAASYASSERRRFRGSAGDGWRGLQKGRTRDGAADARGRGHCSHPARRAALLGMGRHDRRFRERRHLSEDLRLSPQAELQRRRRSEGRPTAVSNRSSPISGRVRSGARKSCPGASTAKAKPAESRSLYGALQAGGDFAAGFR